jgi:hypothetical protein
MTHIEVAALLIRLGIGFNMVVFGLHQMWKPEKWLHYIPKFLQFIMPVKSTSFLRSHGCINFALGILLMIGVWQPAITWISIFWWGSILPFAFLVDFAIGLRDLSIIMALVALLLLV